MIEANKDDLFLKKAKAMGYSFDGEIKIGGNYTSIVRDGKTLYLSGQIPRVENTVMMTGRVGQNITLEQAQLASEICVMRALALLKKELDSLDSIERILRLTVFVQCSDDFTQHSEVSDGASNLLFEILGEQGIHTRTSVGVQQLPKNASVEIDLIVKAV